MKIAVINEGSTKHRNSDLMKALDGTGHEVFNLGMKNMEGEPDLTYVETGLMTALVLNMKAVDFVIGGCGTGQGYMNVVLQFPGVSCGLIMDPVEAFLYSRVNAGNCISLPLNKGYGGIGGDINIRYIMKILFDNFDRNYGAGYPEARAELQINARKKLAKLSLDAHLPMIEILKVMDQEPVKRALTFPGMVDFLKTAPESGLKDYVLKLAGQFNK